ncbi:MAG: hypothetical protein C4583_15985 [Anaerolineaceae bacterium]|nr:MAG: hypothetical protein C4583_15985 [Anaerolineaceae bacterium]
MNTPANTYHKLDRTALWLLVGEFGGAALLLALLILMVVGNLISPRAFNLGYDTGQVITVIIALIYGLAYLGNLVIGIMGLYLYATEKREGYPGTGHLVNWILLSATLAIILVMIAALFSSI